METKLDSPCPRCLGAQRGREDNDEDAERVRVVFRGVRSRVISVIYDVSLLGAPTSISPESSKPRLRRLKKSTQPSTLEVQYPQRSMVSEH